VNVDAEYTSIAGCPTFDCRLAVENRSTLYRNRSMHSTARGNECVTAALRNNLYGYNTKRNVGEFAMSRSRCEVRAVRDEVERTDG